MVTHKKQETFWLKILLYALFVSAVLFVPISVHAAMPKYVYIISPQADVVKYDIASGGIVNRTGFGSDPNIVNYFPEGITGNIQDWALAQSEIFYDSKNMVLYVFIPPVEGGTTSAFVKIQLPDWKLIKGVVLAGHPFVKMSPDFGRLFLVRTECSGTADENGVCPYSEFVDVYDTATLVKTKSYGSSLEDSHLFEALFANDGTIAYHYNVMEGDNFKYLMADNGITRVNIQRVLSEKDLLPAGRWDQMVDKYGEFVQEYNEKFVSVDEQLWPSLIRETFIKGTTGKAALVYTDVTKPAIHGAIIEDIPVEKAQTYLSDDGTRAYVAEYNDILAEDGSIASKKLTGNIYIYI